MKSKTKVVLLAALSGSLSTVAQAAIITVGTLTAVTAPGAVGPIASGTTLLVGDLGASTNLLGLNPNLYNSSTTAPKTFFDDFVFTIAGSSLNSISVSLNTTLTPITGFSESLYSGGVPGTSYTATGTNPLLAANLIGTTTGNTLSFSNLAAGTYTLQFSGTLAMATTTTLLGLPVVVPTVGAYAALISVNAVPEPESYALLLAGLGMMGYLIRRRGTKQA
jgi:hypothetical protein